jgi:hypothetical protein
MFIIALLLLVSVGATSDSIDASRARGCRSCSKYDPKTPSIDRPVREFQHLAQRDVVLTEGFEEIPPNWVILARSDPAGIDTFSQGLPEVFPAQSGPNASYIIATYNGVGAGEPGIIR